MHSNIFEITETAICEEEWMNETTLADDSFIGSIADYVVGTKDRNSDTDWLAKYTVGVLEFSQNRNSTKIKLLAGGKEKYFGSRLTELKEKVSQLSMEDFCCGSGLYTIETLIEDKYSFYVYTDDAILLTLDEFIRSASEDSTYYLGGVLDYHF